METDHDPLRKIPTKHAPEVSADIGGPLKAARVKKGQSLDAVSQHTRIPKKFLDALEGNRLDEFPALAYLRGFLKCYCDYLELEFEPLWRLIVPETPRPEAAAAPPARAGSPAAAPQAAAPAAKAPGHVPPPAHPKANGKPAAAHHEPPAPAHSQAQADAPSSASAAAPAMIIAGVIAVLVGAFLFKPGQKAPPLERQAPLPAALQPVHPPVEPQLTLAFRHGMWVSVTVDGAQKFQGNVPQGSRQEWKAKKLILLRCSDPQALKLTLNGAPFFLPMPDSDGNFHIEAP